MNKQTVLTFEIVKQDTNGGEIMISTPSVDRDRDRVLPEGARIDNYMKNPVVQWGHNYHEPWATIGRTDALEIGTDGIKASFTFREAANDQDPLHIVKTLWDGGFVNTASVGFNPLPGGYEENDEGGFDFTKWELLEWSLVPIPANQDALRLAVKALDIPEHTTTSSDGYYTMNGTSWGLLEPEPRIVYITEKAPREEPVYDFTTTIEAAQRLKKYLKGLRND